jgi:hypothetical protein
MKADAIPRILLPWIVVFFGVLLLWECRTNRASLNTVQYYYVAPTGDDANPGSSQAPFRTIQRGLQAAQPGDTVWVEDGVYSEVISFPRNGEPNRPIVLKSIRREGAVLDGASVSVPNWNGLINIRNRKYIVVEGFLVRNSAQRGIWVKGENDQSHDISIRNCRTLNTVLSGIAIEYTSRVVLEGCQASFAGEGYAGFYLYRNQDVSILDCLADHNGGAGGGLAQGFVFLEGENYLVKNCISRSNARDGFDIGGDATGTQNITLEGCFSFENGEDGFGVNSYAARIHFIRCVGYRNGSNGFNIYQGASRVEVTNCTLVGGEHYFWIDGSDDPAHPVEEVRVRNCIGYGAKNRGIITIQAFRNISFDYNCWTGEYSGYGEFCLWNMGSEEIALSYSDVGSGGNWFRLLQQGEHSFSKDPRFVNPAAANFRLRADSPCIDAGVDVGLPYHGSAPDMGAFEYP